MDFLNLSVSINILNLDRITVNQNWSWKNINSPFSRLYCILDGAAQVNIDSKTHDLLPGNMFLIPCFSNHSYSCKKSMTHFFIHFTSRISKGLDILNIQHCQKSLATSPNHIAMFEELTALNPDRKLLDLTPSINPLLNPDAKQGYHEIANKTKNLGDYFAKVFKTQGLLRILISDFLATSSQSKLDTKISGYNRFNKIIQYIDMNLSQKLTLEELASYVNLNPTYFSNTFFKLIGQRPISYINRKRIEKAQTLLIFSNTSIKKIAFEIGFEDVNYFSRIFSKYTHLPPQKYRILHQSM